MSNNKIKDNMFNKSYKHERLNKINFDSSFNNKDVKSDLKNQRMLDFLSGNEFRGGNKYGRYKPRRFFKYEKSNLRSNEIYNRGNHFNKYKDNKDFKDPRRKDFWKSKYYKYSQVGRGSPYINKFRRILWLTINRDLWSRYLNSTSRKVKFK